MSKSSKPKKKQENGGNKKVVPLILIIIGAACLLGSGFFILDNLTATDPAGLGKWIFDILGFLFGAGASIKGWMEVFKKDEPGTRIVAMDEAQVAPGENGRNIKQGDNSKYFEHVEHYHEAPIDITKTTYGLFTIPLPVTDFTGREVELAGLKALFTNGAIITGLSGGGGIGKTELAQKLAYEIADQYPDARMGINLLGTSQNPLAPDEAMRRILEPFYPNQKLPDEIEQLKGLYQEKFGKIKALLLLDNAADAAQVRPLIPPAPSAAIITSRLYFSLTEHGLNEPLRLDALLPEEARKLLQTASPKLSNALDTEVDSLAKLCGYLPLALRVSASLLNDRADWTLKTLLKRLADEQTRLTRLKRENDIDLNVEATLALSYDLLEDELKKKFRQLGVFTAPFIRLSAQAVWDLPDENEADNLLGKLANRGLLNLLPSPVGKHEDEDLYAYALHDLTRLFALKQLTGDGEEMKQIAMLHANHFLKWASVANNLYLKGNENILIGLAQFRFIWSHLFSAYERLSPDQTLQSRPDEADEWLSQFPDKCVSVLSLHLPPRQKINILKCALDASHRLGKRQFEGNHLSNLGNAYLDLGDAQTAIELYEQQLVIVREIGDRRGEGNALGNLGNAHAYLGDTRKAIKFHEQALAIVREIGDHRGVGIWLGNLGNMYAHLGDARKAIEFYEQELVIVREIGDRRGEGSALGNLGNVYGTLGDTRKAIEFHEQALIIARGIGDRHKESTWLGNLGNAYGALGDARKAIKLNEQALVIAREIGDRRNESIWLGNLGNAYGTLGNAHKAIEYYEQALIIAREIGNRHNEGNILANLGMTYKKLGDKENAKKTWEQTLQIYRAIESPHFKRVENWLSNLDGNQQKEQQGMTVDNFIRMVIEIQRDNRLQAGEIFGQLSKMTVDSEVPVGMQELAKVLRDIMAGIKNPDLSRLPDELAQVIQEELEKK